MPAMTPMLYFLIESAGRELDARLLMAIDAARRGIDVVIGQQWHLIENLGDMPRGVVLFKTMDKRQYGGMERVVDLHGHLAAVCHEEALGVSDVDFVGREIYVPIADKCELLLAQGEVHRQSIEDRTKLPKSKVPVVGNPRMDLLRPEFRSLIEAEAAEIRRKAGRPIVLLNSNCSGANHAWFDIPQYKNLCRQIGWIGDEGDAESELLFDRHIKYDLANMEALRLTARDIADRMPEVLVLVRPHPNEDLNYWVDTCRPYPNIKLSRQGSHLPVMFASEVMLSAGCTTGFEAELLGVPAISIRAGDGHDFMFNIFATNFVNLVADGARDAADKAVRVLRGDRSEIDLDRATRRRFVDKLIVGMEGKFSFERIIDELAALIDHHSTTRVADGWRPTETFVARKSAEVTEYMEEKAAYDIDDVNERLKKFSAALNITGTFKAIPINNMIFQVALV